jgi:hypothetical protein
MLFQTLNAPLLSHLLYSSSEPHHSHTLLSVSYDPASTFPFLDLYPPCSSSLLFPSLSVSQQQKKYLSWSSAGLTSRENATQLRRDAKTPKGTWLLLPKREENQRVYLTQQIHKHTCLRWYGLHPWRSCSSLVGGVRGS